MRNVPFPHPLTFGAAGFGLRDFRTNVGPLMDMDEYQLSHALWLRQQQETPARVQEERNSALALCGKPTSDVNRRG